MDKTDKTPTGEPTVADLKAALQACRDDPYIASCPSEASAIKRKWLNKMFRAKKAYKGLEEQLLLSSIEQHREKYPCV